MAHSKTQTSSLISPRENSITLITFWHFFGVSFTFFTLLASLARSTALIRLFARSLALEFMGKIYVYKLNASIAYSFNPLWNGVVERSGER